MLNRLLVIAAFVTCIGMVGALSGAGMNQLAVKANGGKMPILVRPGYPDAANLLNGNEKEYREADTETKFPWLCDRFYTTIGNHVHSAYSLGDIFIWTGNWIVSIMTPLLALLILIAVIKRSRERECLKNDWKSIVEE